MTGTRREVHPFSGASPREMLAPKPEDAARYQEGVRLGSLHRSEGERRAVRLMGWMAEHAGVVLGLICLLTLALTLALVLMRPTSTASQQLRNGSNATARGRDAASRSCTQIPAAPHCATTTSHKPR